MIRTGLLHFGALAALGFCVAAPAEDKVLFEKNSPYNTIVVTEDEQGLRTLLFDRTGCRQSVVKPGDPDHLVLAYARVVPVGLAFVEEPRSALIVGLGGGTIPSFLRKHYPQTKIDVVDIDPDVVDVAKKFFGFREDPALRAWVNDGRRFVEESRDTYDLVFLDAFGSENIPYHLATQEFLQAVRRILTPRGAVVSNIWTSYHNPLHDRMIRTYQEVFDELYTFAVENSGNEIVVALPHGERISRGELARRAAKIVKEKEFRFPLGDLVRRGYRHVKEKDPGVGPLTDKEKPKKSGGDTKP